MLDFIYHMNLKLLLNCVLREKCQDFIRRYYVYIALPKIYKPQMVYPFENA